MFHLSGTCEPVANYDIYRCIHVITEASSVKWSHFSHELEQCKEQKRFKYIEVTTK